MFEPKARTSHEINKIGRDEFKMRFLASFSDPWFDKHADKIAEIEETAWKAYKESRKAPYTTKAGPSYKDPTYELSNDWLKAKKAINIAQKQHDDPDSPHRVLLISASNRNDQSCPGEISKSSRLIQIAEETLKAQGVEVETLDLSLLTSEYGKTIYPCKACVSTAMPLCHWPCSCYPNHSLGQVHDWMNDIYPMWVRAHGVMIITPVYWHQAPSGLKLMIDRLVCADGGNDDPTSTQGKKADLAKKIEMKGWDYPRHLQGRLYSLVIHGDTMGVDDLKNSLSSWLDEMLLIPSGTNAQIARYIGYYGTYAQNHEELDKDHAIQEEVRLASMALALNVSALRAQKLQTMIPDFQDPRPK